MRSSPAERNGRPRQGLLANTAILSLTMLGVSAGNYLLNVLMARILPPAQFGDANLAINMVLAAAAIAATFQLVTSKTVATRPHAREAVRASLARGAWLVGGGIAAVLVAGAWTLADALQTSTPWLFVIIGLGLPFYFLQAVHRGVLQGDLRIPRLAASYAIEALVRVAGAIALLLAGLGVVGACLAISLSFVASGSIARHRGAKGTPDAPVPTPRPRLRPVLAGAAVLLAGQVIITNGDVVLSKAFFDPETAGVYAAAALVGRAVFFLSWSIVHVVFPLAARSEVGHEERRAAFRQALALVAGIGLMAMVVVHQFGELTTSVVFGDAYAAGTQLLMPYVAATSLFAVANLVSSVDLAVGRKGASLALLFGSLLQTGLLVIAGSTPMGMVQAQFAAMACTLVVVSLAYMAGERAARPAQTYGAQAPIGRRNITFAKNYERGMNVNKDMNKAMGADTAQGIDLSVVIPAYNEKDRIVPTIGAFVAHLSGSGLNWEIIVSDDGSTDHTPQLVEMLGQSEVRVLRAEANAGKGAAVRRGLQAAAGAMVLFADADCSTPVGEVDLLIERIRNGADLAIGSRAQAGASVANRSLLRRTLTAGLRRIVALGLGVGVDDTQCGFKLFTSEAAQRVASAQTVEGFSFDLEILHLAERFEYEIVEVPVRWYDAPGSKVDTRKEVARFLGSIARIRFNSVRGAYRHA